MANWAKLQEQLTGKRVIKRAKHSIHFDNGDGTFTANFSNTPCHFQDTDGLWKPIDTKLLLLPDGFYGCPHSDVKIHKDGRVKVGDYQHKSTLVAAKEGVVDGDRIVREFEFGTQYLYMTEDGFRQETIITRPPTTQEAKFLIATETGKLPSKYHRSDITAVDANGDIHEFVNLGQFKKWLDGAVYPVTIDPDFAVSTADGVIFGENDTYATARSTFTKRYTSVGSIAAVGQVSRVTSPYFIVYRSFLAFDTSSIGAGSTITQVNLKVRTLTYEAPANDFDVQIVKFNLSGKTFEEQYDGILAAPADDSILCNTADGAGDKTSGNLSTVWVNKAGTTYYGLRSSRDYSNTEPSGYERIGIYFAEHETEAYRPVLTVTYSAYPVSYARPNIHLTRKVSTTTYPIMFLMVDSTDHVTGKTGLTPKAVISKNGAIFGGAAGVISEIGGGLYSLAGNATDRDTLGELWIHIEGGAGVDKCDIKVDIVSHDPYGLATPTNITAGTITTATNLTNLPTMPADWVTAAGVKADAVTKIQSGLATATALATAQADLDNPDQYKADVSGLATTAHVQEVENKVDLIDVTTVASMGKIDALDVKVSAIDTDSLMQYLIDGYTFEQIVEILAAVLAGKLTRNINTLTFRDLADTLDRLVVVTDNNKQRTDITYTV